MSGAPLNRYRSWRHVHPPSIFSVPQLRSIRLLIPCQSAGVKQTVSTRIRGGWLAAYVTRGEARPAYKRAFAAQLAVYTGKPPTG
jgi:glutathione S-transferase